MLPRVLLALALPALACSNAGKTDGPAQPPQGPVCTREAKVCPDGSAVGRTGPNCEFSPCPGEGGDATPPPKACTQEAKVCPDGSAVGRTGPNCEFAPCPGA